MRWGPKEKRERRDGTIGREGFNKSVNVQRRAGVGGLVGYPKRKARLGHRIL